MKKKQAWIIIYSTKHYVEGTMSGTKGKAWNVLCLKYKYSTWDEAKKAGYSARKIEWNLIDI